MKIHFSGNRIKCMNANGSIRSASLTCHTSNAEPQYISDEAVLAEVLAASPQRIGAAQIAQAEIIEYHGCGVYEIEVSYEYRPETTAGFSSRRDRDEQWFISTSNTVERIFSARKTIAYGSNAPDPENLVNWNGKKGKNCAASGADIITATIRENCVLTMDIASFNTAFRKKLVELTGCVNSKVFHNWAAGEVLFLGAGSGKPYENDQGDELIDITLQFAIRPNRSLNFNELEIAANGWDVVWPWGSENAFVSKVYPEQDLCALGVGR